MMMMMLLLMLVMNCPSLGVSGKMVGPLPPSSSPAGASWPPAVGSHRGPVPVVAGDRGAEPS